MAKKKSAPSGIVRVGCAGWSLPKEHAGRFPAEGTHLARYAGRFPAVEINSSFYKPHRPATYTRWAASVPADFRFSVKVPKVATHERRLVGAGDVLDAFRAEATQLGDKLGPLLVQLPPSLSFSADVAEGFFASRVARTSRLVRVAERQEGVETRPTVLQGLRRTDAFLVRATRRDSSGRGWPGQLVVLAAKPQEGSVQPADGNAHGPALLVVPRRAPGPVAGMRD